MRRVVAIALVLAASALPACTSGASTFPSCAQQDDTIFMLMAQSVPSATRLPCVAQLPAGWRFAGSEIRDGVTQLWLDSDVAGIHAVQVELVAACDVGEAVEVPLAPDEVDMHAYVQPDLPPGFSGAKFLRFEGGCVVYRFRFTGDAPPTLALEAEEAMSFLPRAAIVSLVSDEIDRTLCGAGAPPCAG